MCRSKVLVYSLRELGVETPRPCLIKIYSPEKILETGFILSFTGLITFVKEMEKVVREVPLDKMMIETDSPYLSPIPHRGKKNEPAFVMHVAEKIAAIKGIKTEEVAANTTATAYNLFTKLKS